MEITFANADLERLCTVDRVMQKRLGQGAKQLRRRLADLQAAASLGAVIAGRPHPLTGDRRGQFAFSLDGARRLVLECANEPPPLDSQEEISWTRVTAIRIVYIGDYHD